MSTKGVKDKATITPSKDPKEIHKVSQMLGDIKEEWKISMNGEEEKVTITPTKDPDGMHQVLQIQGATEEDGTTTPSKDPKEMHEVPQMQGDNEEDWIRSLMASAEEKAPITPSKGPKVMHRVPQVLRDTMANCVGCYKPSVVSIGPYHSSDTCLLEVQKLKPKIAKQFHQIEKEANLGQFFNNFKDKMNEHNFKDLYIWDTTELIEDGAFKRMMFLDGCFILGFIECIASRRIKKLGMKSNLITSVQKDLFLLENQLPYQVLQILIKLVNDNKIPYYWEYMLAEFVDWNNKFLFTWNQYRSPHGTKSPDHDHLLHIQWTRLLGKPSRHIRSCLPAFCKPSRKIHLFRGVKELTEAGIQLRPNQTGYIKDVNFWSYGIFGRLTLPHMTIDRSTRPMFLNVIAYEACSNESCWFTSYICFLDLLIDRAEDVKKLRSAGILDNRLGSDDEVAKLFNEIAADLEPESDTYDNIKRRIRLHFSFRRKIRIVLWVLEGIRDHFKNPWTTFAVLGGSFVIFLTAVQTFFTVYPQSSLKLSSKHRLF